MHCIIIIITIIIIIIANNFVCVWLWLEKVNLKQFPREIFTINHDEILKRLQSFGYLYKSYSKFDTDKNKAF